MLDRERCIQCARCTRFGDIIAGDHALEFIDRGYKLEVGTPKGGPAESKFIGNTIMICPVGALTSDVYRFRARPWDNQPTESSCTLCPVGCSMILDERDGEIVRTRSLENRDVNDIWLCDKGWFGYEFISHPDRLKTPMIRRGGTLQPASWEEALSLIAAKMEEAKPSGKLAAFGGNPLTVEENYLFQKLMREGCGVNHVDHRIGMPLFNRDEEGLPPGMEMSIGDCENLETILLLGLDLTEEFPLIWLRVKQAINKGAKSYFFGHYAPEIAPHLTKLVLHPPGKELEILPQIKELSGNAAIFVGRQYLQGPQRKAILSKLLQLGLPLNVLEGRGNSLGARFAGMRPDFGAGEKPLNPGMNAQEVVQTAAQSGWELLYVAGADPASKFPSMLWREARAKLKFLVVQDLFLTETAKEADVLLPTLSYVEKEGHFMNIERRLQKLRPGKPLPEELYSDAEIFKRLAEKLRLSLAIDPQFSELLKMGRLPLTRPAKVEAGAIPAQEKGLKATFAPALFDEGVRMRHNPHVRQLAKAPRVRLHPQEGEKLGLKEGDKVTLKANGAAISGILQLDAKVAEGTLVLPLGFAQFPVQELGLNLMNGMRIEVQYAR